MKIKKIARHSMLLILLIVAIGAAVCTYFLYKYWYPPVTAIPYSEVGKTVMIDTNYGIMEFSLRPEVRFANSQFTQMARSGFYDGTRIHRIVKNLLIEGGDPLTKDPGLKQLWGRGGSEAVFKNETSKHDEIKKGTLAFAGSNLGTYGSHFIIITNPVSWLTGANTVLGQMTSGFGVLDAISHIPADRQGAPEMDVVVYSVTVL